MIVRSTPVGQKPGMSFDSRHAFFKSVAVIVLSHLATKIIKHLHWCRWADSNRHAFLHCPLKTACLPIPPHRHKVILRTIKTVRYDNYSGISGISISSGSAGISPITDCDCSSTGCVMTEGCSITLVPVVLTLSLAI